MNSQDIRWQQRFVNYQKSLAQLEQAVNLYRQRELSALEKQGFVKAFEFTHELAWNVLKDYFEYQGNNSIKGSRDATREAFKMAIISDGEGWMEMIKSRNQSSHTYDEETVEQIIQAIVNLYYDLFSALKIEVQKLKEQDDNALLKE